MEVCQRMGWTVEYWLTLSEIERTEWLAWRLRRQRELKRILDMMQYEESDKETGEAKHYVRDYGAYIDTLKELYGVR